MRLGNDQKEYPMRYERVADTGGKRLGVKMKQKTKFKITNKEMKMKAVKAMIIGLTALLCACAGGKGTTLTLTNNLDIDRVDYPVLVKDVPEWAVSAVVTVNGEEVASQIDLIDGAKELAFVCNIPANSEVKAEIAYSEEPGKEYTPRVFAEMFLKLPNGEMEERDMIEGFEDNMYNALHHHGPAFETDLAAYRIYFDNKQTVDIYAKIEPGLEIEDTRWYPSQEQMDAGYGDDVLVVYGTIGLGTLKAWDKELQAAVHIKEFTRREARILAYGPVRTVAQMRVEGWGLDGKKINCTSRYIMYAGHRDVEIENIFEGDTEGLTFCTGVMKMKNSTSHITDDALAVWGRDIPRTDIPGIAEEWCGLGVYVPAAIRQAQTEDRSNHVALLTPDAEGKICYSMTFSAAKENFGYDDAESFYKYIDQWSYELNNPVIIK